jgi:hypothetical protein
MRFLTGTASMTQNLSGLTRRGILGAAVVLLAIAIRPGWAQASPIVVYKDPNCGCCSGWVRHLEKAGFVVKVSETADIDTIRQGLGVPADLASCHTADVDGYVLEGHVPAAAVRRLLEERPNGIGLAVPGMPAGSPGMGGDVPQKYEVVLFGATDRQTFMRFIGTDIAG